MATLEIPPLESPAEPEAEARLDFSENEFVYGGEGQWRFDSQVIDWFEEQEPTRNHKGITLYKEVARMSDGFDYQVHTLTPAKQRTDVPVVYTTPWWTSDRGHNLHAALRVAELGYTIQMIGPEGNYREPFHQWLGRLVLHGQEVWKELKQIEMARTAHNMHQILDANGGHHYYDKSQIVLLGESRGAMVGMGEEAFSAAHDRNVIYADLVAPCFAEAFDLEEAVRSLEYRKQGVQELKTIGKVVMGAAWSRFRHYPDTLNPSPKALLHQVFTARTLFSGQAGEMARHIPLDRNMHIRAFKGDHAGQAIQWERIFARHPGVIVNPGEGSHLSIAATDTLYEILGRLAHLRSELERTDDNGTEIDYEQVHLHPQLRAVA